MKIEERLYKACDTCQFAKLFVSEKKAKEFASIAGTPKYFENGGTRWWTATNGKTRVTAFFKKGEPHEDI